MRGDPRRFLGAQERVVLPYLGGPFVYTRDRRLDLASPIDPGYWAFDVRGRTAQPVEPSGPPPLGDLPAVDGHLVVGYVAHGAGAVELVFLPPPGEPPRFSPVRARRWPSRILLHDTVPFETGAEELARQAYEERRTLAGERAVPATLRAAFGYAVLLRAGAELGVPVAPIEAGRSVGEIADGGDPVARAVVRKIQEHRALQRIPAPAIPTGGAALADERIAIAIAAAGGTLLDIRGLGDGTIEVRYVLQGARFASIAEDLTLNVLNAGICLDGTDGDLTMESLPGVILEAIRNGELNLL